MVLVEPQCRLNPIVLIGNEGVEGTHALDIVRLHPLEDALSCDWPRAKLARQLGSDLLKCARRFHDEVSDETYIDVLTALLAILMWYGLIEGARRWWPARRKRDHSSNA